MAKTKRHGFPRRHRLRPRAELLDERVLLSPFVVSKTDDSGPGSLRQAILDADAGAGPSTITFAIKTGSAPFAINLASPLPPITVPVVLDGESQPGYAGSPIVEINGGGLVGDGLPWQTGCSWRPAPTAAPSKVWRSPGFPDSSFTDGAGIHLLSSGNLVQSNYLGTNATGKAPGLGNYIGVFVDGSSGNTIGGTGSLGNLISGNLFDGVLILDEALPAQNNLVAGNRIGTDSTGTAALPNGSPSSNGNGIDVFASTNTIGGPAGAGSNLISGNQGYGIFLGGNNNVVRGNLMGTDLTGTHALGNLIDGVTDNGGSGNTIGGTATGEGNLISANLAHGISLTGASRDEVLGNLIGTTPGQITDAPFKFQPLGNQGSGVLVNAGSTQNTIGGTTAGAGNLIVANQDSGIILSGADSNVVSGNAMGTTLAKGSSIGIGPPVNLGNASDGILLLNSSANTIGGADQLDATGNIALLGGNVVSSNGQAGISDVGNDTFLPGNQGNVILGNLVGTSADGSAERGQCVDRDHGG